MINRVVLTGRLSRDIELKNAGWVIGGIVYDCSLPTLKEKEKLTFNCVIRGKLSENFCKFTHSKFTHKGLLIGDYKPEVTKATMVTAMLIRIQL